MSTIITLLLYFIIGLGSLPAGNLGQEPIQQNKEPLYETLPATPKISQVNRAQIPERLSKLNEVYDRLSLELIEINPKKDGIYLTVRKLYHHREKLSKEEEEQLRQAIYEALDQSFPLYLDTYLISDKPNIVGIISKIDSQESKILVVDKEPFAMNAPVMQNANWLSFSKDATLRSKNGQQSITFDDFKIGQQVEAWTSKFKAMSYPAQTRAYELNILESQK